MAPVVDESLQLMVTCDPQSENAVRLLLVALLLLSNEMQLSTQCATDKITYCIGGNGWMLS